MSMHPVCLVALAALIVTLVRPASADDGVQDQRVGDPADYTALQNAADAAWAAAAPLKIRTAVFAKDKVPGFGDYAVRSSSVFRTGEVMHVYVEPLFYLKVADR